MDLEHRFSEQEIRSTVCDLARRISQDYAGERPLLVGVLKGAFVFLADLVRELTIPAEIDFVRARSYGTESRSSGSVEITKDIEADLRDRHVIVVEDIADTGLTMDVVVERIKAGHPASVKRCALLVREGCATPDYAGLNVGPGFVVGYGIDYAEEYRGLRDIRAVPGTAGEEAS
ncbi:MAG: hypoxanthine phosphoribosyltransferase [Acidobacteria bacterium]|nr:hypoxanthine phosphoribosyltransferase [Acidobacteriota bacterium]NIM60955.1 hypoxanthine phosphoribosyltransferase [Acidobacteriota bacterium]NIO60445.1 hypoxanthine phosphoribosyltransferase [Acidobacteriota bacterium]NIQ31543.1 hypoxanthine phosphoribosyltransferase [Acidobacteriota bacterium]NIQ86795.1 hypoxanthine phosphoribosyltransferase [Acidobacteriota bacterium]